MRSREQEDEQVVAIVTVIFGSALMWFLPLGLIAMVASSFDVLNSAFPYVCLGFGVTVVLWLSARSRRTPSAPNDDWLSNPA